MVPVLVSRSRWILLLIVFAGCRMHTLEDGAFTLTPTETLRDDCGLAGSFGTLQGTLRTEGHLVELALAQPDLRLVGTYRYGVEEMVMDGTVSNLNTTLNGRACLVESVAYHLETETDSPAAFTGSMSIQYDTRQDDGCSCRYWFRFRAQR